MSKAISLALLTTCALCIAACSDDTATSPQRQLRAVPDTAFWPLAVGNEWHYGVRSDPNRKDDIWTVRDEITVEDSLRFFLLEVMYRQRKDTLYLRYTQNDEIEEYSYGRRSQYASFTDPRWSPADGSKPFRVFHAQPLETITTPDSIYLDCTRLFQNGLEETMYCFKRGIGMVEEAGGDVLYLKSYKVKPIVL
jgi:hypothetical protein